MKKLILALITALFLAATFNDVYHRFFADGNYFTLFTFLTIGILLGTLVVSRVLPFAEQAPGKGRSNRSRGNRSNSRNKPRKRSNEQTREASNNNRRGRGNSTKEAKKQSENSPQDTGTTEPQNSGPRENGTVKWFNRNKGFGFLVRENGDEIFVHFRAIRPHGDNERRVLKDGQAVSFCVVERDKGPQADDVTPA